MSQRDFVFHTARDRTDALDLSHQEAIRRGSAKPGDVTQFWWPVIDHRDGRVALRIDVAPDALAVKTADEMRLDGWFDRYETITDGVSGPIKTPRLADI